MDGGAWGDLQSMGLRGVRQKKRNQIFKGFPGVSDGKESAYNEGDLGSIPGSERFPGGGHDNPRQYSCLENPHGQRSLVGYTVHGITKSQT